MSYCPRCDFAGGGCDRTGRIRTNHQCRWDQLDTPQGYAELNAEEIAAAKQFDEECRVIAERCRADIAAADEQAEAAAIAEERRQQLMRDDHRKLMEQRRRDAQLAEITHKLTYGGEC